MLLVQSFGSRHDGLCWYSARHSRVSEFDNSGYRGYKEIEEWIPQYTERNTSGCVSPQGHISAVRAGWPERPAFPSATTEIYLDIRCNPRTLPGEVKAQFAEFMTELHKRHPEIEFDWEMTGSSFGGATDQQNWIIQSSYRGWEQVEGRPHGEPPQLGGQTDGAIIRRLGIPCARIGFPWPPEDCPEEYTEGLGGMGVAKVADFMKSAKAIMYVVIDSLTRTRSEVGL